jgi:hypothetical protein
VIEKQISEEISANRLRLKTLIDVVRWLAFQSYPFRGHDESAKSMNQGNFLEMVDLLAYNEEVKVVVLSNALLCAGLPAPQLASCCAICLEEFMSANGAKIASRGYLSECTAYTLSH